MTTFQYLPVSAHVLSLSCVLGLAAGCEAFVICFKVMANKQIADDMFETFQQGRPLYFWLWEFDLQNCPVFLAAEASKDIKQVPPHT